MRTLSDVNSLMHFVKSYSPVILEKCRKNNLINAFKNIFYEQLPSKVILGVFVSVSFYVLLSKAISVTLQNCRMEFRY